MALKTFVKISNVSNLSDARYCAGMGVNILGFNLAQDTGGFVDPDMFREITEWVAGVKFAGEFKDTPAPDIRLAIQHYNLDFVETSSVALLEALADLNLPLILKLEVHSEDQLAALSSQLDRSRDLASLFIIDCLEPSLHEELQRVLLHYKELKLIRSYDLSEANAATIAAGDVFYGLELEGSSEERPGFKDYGDIMDILEVLEED